MRRLLLACVCGGIFSSAVLAADPYEKWLTLQQQRGMKIENIRVASEKPLIAAKETDAVVASILEELEAIEEESSNTETGEGSQ